ncbi:hypothetical protein NQ317_008408 [Molorchus minor]|uniref:Uncharacterized protein n=1 Tax=Molorchus minor TaxID=1323400 RepID=A0ABQ9K698_9CUCU|nr:hypothetical protein NQ317_008408 [Molorchus minor]
MSHGTRGLPFGTELKSVALSSPTWNGSCRLSQAPCCGNAKHAGKRSPTDGTTSTLTPCRDRPAPIAQRHTAELTRCGLFNSAPESTRMKQEWSSTAVKAVLKTLFTTLMEK